MQRVFLFLLLGLSLTGCRTFWDPTFMPAGYSYHSDEYHAPPGPEADNIGYDYAKETNAEVLEVWRIVVSDLIDSLEDRTDLQPQPIYVRPIGIGSAFYSAFDNTVREELRERGYELAADNEGFYIQYQAFDPQEDKMVYKPEERLRLKDYLLTLTLFDSNVLSGHASGVYKVPGYGYQSLLEDEKKPLPLPLVHEEEN